jgi:hypothetical protein
MHRIVRVLLEWFPERGGAGVCFAALPAVFDSRCGMQPVERDRRHPRVRVDNLRRDLRHADEHLFTLSASARSGEKPKGRRGRTGPVVLSFLLIAALATAVWGARVPRSMASRDVRVQVTPVPVSIVNTARASNADVEPPVRAAQSISMTPRRVARRPLRAIQTRQQPAVARVHSSQRRSAPRPLSPGEFGRPPDFFRSRAVTDKRDAFEQKSHAH